MQFMLTDNMDTAEKSQNNIADNETRTEMSENASDRESSIESFHTNKSEISITTETELIDVDDIELSDEESWLYKSPKKLSSDEKNLSTQKWLQKDVEEMDDVELTITRTALLSKLNQLEFLNSKSEEMEMRQDLISSELLSKDSIAEEKKTEQQMESADSFSKKKDSKTKEIETKQDLISLDFLSKDPITVEMETKQDLEFSDSINKGELKSASSDNVSMPDSKYLAMENKVKTFDENKPNVNSENWKSSEILDVVDVQKIAKLQEESLKQSAYKFLSKTGRKTPSSRDLSPVSSAQMLSLNKPASVEALNTCMDKTNHPNMHSIVPLQGMRKPIMFGSASALNSSQELHRGSLPNINKGYYSLKTRKPKNPSDPKMSCPLPIYPTHSKVMQNGTISQVSYDSLLKSKSASYNHRETHTLPSSYRVNSRSNSSSRKDLNTLTATPRRESVPILGNSSTLESRNSHRKFSSPVPSMTVHPRYNTSPLVSPTKPLAAQSHNFRSPPSQEYHRIASHSPSRRLPLSTVQQQSPKKANPLPRNGEIRSLKASSKIPSPTLRSGIPVPSTYMSRANEDDSWSQDCF